MSRDMFTISELASRFLGTSYTFRFASYSPRFNSIVTSSSELSPFPKVEDFSYKSVPYNNIRGQWKKVITVIFVKS